MSPIVGYLLAAAALLQAPFPFGSSPMRDTASQCAELASFLLKVPWRASTLHLKDPRPSSAFSPYQARRLIGAVNLARHVVSLARFLKVRSSGVVFGMAISAASTVVLTRVLFRQQSARHQQRATQPPAGWRWVSSPSFRLVLFARHRGGKR